MQNFPSYARTLKFSRLNHEGLLESRNLFSSFPIHSIHLLIPGSKSFTEKYEDILLSDENVYFIVKNITAASLIEPNFLEHFVRKGSLWAVTHNANAEFDNFLSILPSGKLILSLEKSVADCLSLNKEHFGVKKKIKKNFETFIIDVMTHFSPDKKLYKSVLFELNKLDDIHFTLLLKWKPAGNVCCQSICNYFKDQGFECVACEPSRKHSIKFSVPVPKINFDSFEASICEEVLEWSGAQICGIEYAESDDNYATKFTVPEPSEIYNGLYSASWSGFYSDENVFNLLKKIRKVFEMDSSVPFVILSISGFQDCYIVGKGFQRLSSADKLVCVVIFPSLHSWAITLNSR